jgi:monoamine oxidase
LQLLYNLPTVTIAGVQVISSDEAYTVQGGSGQIIQRLAQALDGQIQTRHRLQSIQSRGHAFWLSFANRVTVEADYVILATPFTALRQVDLRVNLPPTLRRFIQAVNLGLNEKLLAEFRDRVWRQEDGFTQEAWTDFGCSEIWEDSQRQPAVKAGVLTFYLGGNEVQVPYPSVKIQGQTFVNQLNAVLPGIRRASSDRYFRTGWTQDPDIGGSYTSFQPGQYLEFSDYLYIESRNPAERQNVNVGNLVFAGEQFSDEFYGFMNGAAQTGRLAAALVLSRMHQV